MANVTGTNLADLLDGNDGVTNGNDKIFGLAGNDDIYGLKGDDLLRGGLGADDLFGGKGRDTADYSDSSEGVIVFLDNSGDTSNGTAEGDTFSSIENVTGSTFDDSLWGDQKDNELVGKRGDDTLKGAGGADELIGGNGKDTLKGGGGADRLEGGDHSDDLDGGDGKDILIGGKGNDDLAGGDNDDILKGGKGADTFHFNTDLGPNNVDEIKKFKVSEDMIGLDEEVFTAIGPTVQKSEFVKGSKAKDGNDYLIYNKDNGKLFYDENGNASGGKTLFAVLDPNLKLKASHFEINDYGIF